MMGIMIGSRPQAAPVKQHLLTAPGPSSWSSSLSTLSSRSEDIDYDNDCDSEATVDLDDPAIASSPLALSFLKETLQLRRISNDYELANSCPPEIVETHWSSNMRERSRSRMKRSAVDEENEMGENWSSGVHKRTPQEQKGDGDDDNSSLLSIRKLISSRRRSRSDIEPLSQNVKPPEYKKALGMNSNHLAIPASCEVTRSKTSKSSFTIGWLASVKGESNNVNECAEAPF